MIKKFTLLLLAMLCIAGVKAKTNPKETELLTDGDWTASWTAKSFAAQSGAKVGDVIRIHVTHTYSGSGWDYSQFRITNKYGGDTELSGTTTYVRNLQSNINEDFDYEITNASDLEIIQISGFGLTGDNCTITSVKLITYDESYDAVSITVGSDGVATYSNGNKNVQISACDALKAYYASAVAEGTVTLTELTGCIPASTGVIVYGDEGTYTVPVGGEGWPSITTNYLKATGDYPRDVARSVEGTYHYIFAKDNTNGEIGFYKLAEDYSRVTTEKEGDNEIGTTVYYHRLAAHKAYLETTKDYTPDDTPESPSSSPKFGGSKNLIRLSFGGGEGTTAINTALKNPIVEDGIYYTLQGVAVKNPSKGIYILNGKKVFVK